MIVDIFCFIQFGKDFFSQLFVEFYVLLIKVENILDDVLCENFMFVQCDKIF